MADSYPMMSASNWWTIRKKFVQKIPPEVTPSYLASVLNIQEGSAKVNIIPYLRQMGIIDQDGKPSDRARKWRDNDQYPSVCSEIIEEIYPEELRAIAPDANVDKKTVAKWFANKLGIGESAAGKMASFYLILVKADPSMGEIRDVTNQRQKPTISKIPKDKKQRGSNDIPLQTNEQPQSPAAIQHVQESASLPSININLQIHISSDASIEQIDQMFASMAKHIYKKG